MWLKYIEEELHVLKPKIVCLLGKQVSDFIISKMNLYKESDSVYSLWEITFLTAYHPSYISVYKRKNMQEYIDNLTSLIKKYNRTSDIIIISSWRLFLTQFTNLSPQFYRLYYSQNQAHQTNQDQQLNRTQDLCRVL